MIAAKYQDLQLLASVKDLAKDQFTLAGVGGEASYRVDAPAAETSADLGNTFKPTGNTFG